MDGSATLVTLTSRSVMNMALQQTMSAIQRARPSSGVTRSILPPPPVEPVACPEEARDVGARREAQRGYAGARRPGVPPGARPAPVATGATRAGRAAQPARAG